MVVKTTPPAATLSSSRRWARSLRLLGLLAQELLAAGECAEELLVEVVAVGDDDERRVLHLRMQHDASGVEGHGEALARALRVPDDADPASARRGATP